MSDKFSPLPFRVTEETISEVVNYMDWITIGGLENE